MADNQNNGEEKKTTSKEAEEKLGEILAKSKKSGKRVDPSASAKEALKSVSSITQTIDVNNIVDKVLKRTEYSMTKQMSWPDILSYFEKDQNVRNLKTNELVDQLISEGAADSTNARKLRYKEYYSAIKKLPILNKILRIYTANVLSPDDITKISVRVVPVNNALDDDETIKYIIGKFTIIMDKINLEKYVSETVYKTFFFGDYFIEIQSSKRSLMQTLYNLQIPVIESCNSLKKLEATTVNKHTYDILDPYTRKAKLKLHVEETLPIGTQIADTSNSITNLIHELFHVPTNGVLTESFIDSTLSQDVTLKNVMNIIRESVLPFNEEELITLKIKDEKAIDAEDKYNKKMSNVDNLKHVIDILPTEASLSNIALNPIDPDKIVVLEKDNVCYGYLFISGVESGASTGAGSIINSSSSMSSVLSNPINTGIETEKQNTSMIVANFVTSLSDYFKEKFGETNEDGSNKFTIESMAPGLQQLISDILNSEAQTNDLMVRFIPPGNIQHFKRKGSGCYEPYGESMLDDLMFLSRMVLADNISSTINKISKVGKRLKFGVKGNTYQQAMNNLMNVKKAVAKQNVTLDSLGSMDVIPSNINSQKNIYIPIVNGEEQMTVDTFDMGSYQDLADPGNQMTKQLITGSDIPPAFLGYDEFTNSKANLTSENVVFAQNIISAQKEFADQFTELMQKIYLALYLKTKDFDMSFKQVKFTFNAPRSIMLNIFAENLGYLDQIIGSLEKLDIPTDKIIERYFPELISFDLKITQTINKLNARGQGQNGTDENGFASFDNGGFGNMDLGGGDMGMGQPPMDNTGATPIPPADNTGGMDMNAQTDNSGLANFGM